MSQSSRLMLKLHHFAVGRARRIDNACISLDYRLP
jgi:hypothetical protein